MTSAAGSAGSDVEQRRHHRAPGVFNLRDLGGYPAGAQWLRWARLFRADGLHRTDGDGVAVVAGLGIRRVLDLRTNAERAADGVFAHPEMVALHVPLLDEVWGPAELVQGHEADFLYAGYVQMAFEGGDRIARALRLVAEGCDEPLVFHCSAGKDRTGVVAALVLAVLGVDDDVIADDFALSEPAMEAMAEWYRVHRDDQLNRRLIAKGLDAEGVMRLLSARPETMHRFLEELRRRHGTVAGYVAALGVEDEVVGRLADHLLV